MSKKRILRNISAHYFLRGDQQLNLEQNFLELIEKIVYRKTIIPIEKAILSASGKLLLSSNKANSREELDQILAGHQVQLEIALYPGIASANHDFELFRGNASYHLNKKFGIFLGPIYDIGLTGAEGGIKALLDLICNGMIANHTRMKRSSHVQDFLDPLALAEYNAIAGLYVKFFAGVLPVKINRYIGNIRFDPRETLIQHPFRMKNLPT